MVACFTHNFGLAGGSIKQFSSFSAASSGCLRELAFKPASRSSKGLRHLALRAQLREGREIISDSLVDAIEVLEKSLIGPADPKGTLRPPDMLEAAKLGMSPTSQQDTASAKRRAAKARHQLTYKIAAITASLGVTSLAVAAVHYRFAWNMRNGGDVPWADAALTILLTFGGVIGMEMWARWAHRALWHDFAPGWALHSSHHKLRMGPFEANDVFAIVNAAPAIALLAYGFFTPTITGGIAFGSGLGITLFGMMYMFVHDGLVHKRFPVGPLADVPYLRRVAAAHKLHHAERYKGVPWGLFLGPQELEAVGGKKELDYLCRQQDAANQKKS